MFSRIIHPQPVVLATALVLPPGSATLNPTHS